MQTWVLLWNINDRKFEYMTNEPNNTHVPYYKRGSELKKNSYCRRQTIRLLVVVKKLMEDAKEQG